MKLWRKPFDIEVITPKPATAHINLERCKGCGYCAAFCPRGVLEMTGELGPKGYETVRVADQAKCLGCGLCEAICPEFGIYLTQDEESAVKSNDD